MANASIPQVFDRSLRRLAYLENAMAVSYDLPLNALWAASFALPAADPKNVYCASLNYVEIFDGAERIDLFRIIGEDLKRSTEAIRVYTCEHVLATLLNDVLFRYHQIGGLGIPTPQVLSYILAQQTTVRWVLGRCDFQRQFEYSFENENLLSALFATANCFDEEYEWRWDTTAYPWRLSLVRPDTELASEIRWAKNMTGIRRAKDDTQIVNRIYALGYGEGVNQLGIEEVNGGLPYVEDVISQREYGLCSSILVDGRFEVSENLKAYALQILEQSSTPYVSYEADALDLYRLLGDTSSRFWPGQIIRVIDTEDGITVRTRIVEVAKDDVRGDPGTTTVTLANREQDVAGSISDLQNRARINETYAQGATNLTAQSFADNADPQHPAVLKVLIPEETIRINKVLLSVEFEAFRGYSQATDSAKIDLTSTESGGGTTSSATGLESSNVKPGETTGQAVHNHGIAAGTLLQIATGGSVAWVPSGAHTHPAHTHNIPPHSHGISMPPHAHDMTYGIYEGQQASSAVVKVDGNDVPGGLSYDGLDVAPYMATDSAGRIQRGVWHTIEITPDRQSRIVAAVFTQLFVNSRGGGDY